MYGYIYLTTNLINNKIYVGQHISENFDSKYKGSGVLLTKAIKKYGWNNFICEILYECSSLEELNTKEMEYILKLDATNPQIGYNIKLGGANSPCPENVKRKISETQKLNPNRSMLGRKHTDATKQLMSKSSLGRKKSKDACYHMSISKKGNHNNHGCNRERIWINDGIKEIMISQSDFGKNEYVNFTKGRLPKDDKKINDIKNIYENRVYINNSIVEKCVDKNELDYYLSNGWIMGTLRTYYKDENRSKKISNQLKGRIAITNGEVIKMIFPNELSEYEEKGYYKKSKRNTQ